MNLVISIMSRPQIILCVLCCIAVFGVIAFFYKVYIRVPHNKDVLFYKNWVQQKGGLHVVFKRYGNHLPKEFFAVFDTFDDYTIALNLIDRDKHILYKRIMMKYISFIQNVRNISCKRKVILLCELYSQEYDKTGFFTNNVSKILFKKILNMIFQSRECLDILHAVVWNVKEGTPLRKLLEKKLHTMQKTTTDNP